MKIAEDYFQRLLGSVDPLDAVTTLDQLWCAREGVAVDRPQLGLSFSEYVVHLVLMYDGEVGNGGHLQFFGNRGEFWSDTLRALREVNLVGRASVLQRAVRVFTSEMVPADAQLREQILDALSQEQLRQLDQYDRDVYGLSENVDEACLRYIRAHASEILVPERAA